MRFWTYVRCNSLRDYVCTFVSLEWILKFEGLWSLVDHCWTSVSVNMLGQPFVNVWKLLLAHSTLSSDLHTLVFFGSGWILEVNGLEMVFEGIAPRKDPGVVAAMIRWFVFRIGRCRFLRDFKRTFELSLVTSDFLPVALDVSEQIVGTGKTSAAVFANMRTGCGL